MASRRLTADFVRQRGARRRSPRAWTQDDQAPLVAAAEDTDIELGYRLPSTLPPDWVDDSGEAHELMSQIKKKIKTLNELHGQHLKSFSRSMEEEHRIEIITSEITALFHRCQKIIQVIGRKGKGMTPENQTITKNVVTSLARELQDMSMVFRKSQSSYLKRMKGQEDRVKGYGSGGADLVSPEDDAAAEAYFDKGFSDQQQAHLRDNTTAIQQRDEEILSIVKSISELATIFKDLAVLIVDQGTILDRIDYNIELASHHIEEGHTELQKAEKYHKKASKKLLIIFLCMVVITMIFVVIFAKRQSD